jgi:hypothetical protein
VRGGAAAIRQDITVRWAGASQAQGEALLVEVAKQGHAKIMREATERDGAVPSWTAFGDVAGRPIEQAKKVIVFQYYYVRGIILAILRALQDESPVDSGAYRRSHQLYIDGHAVGPNTVIKPGQDVMIANSVPYARRLEVGKTAAGRDFLISKPNRIYERVGKMLASRYRNAAKITFGYVTLPGAHAVKGRLSSHIGRKKRRQHAGTEVQAPALFINLE